MHLGLAGRTALVTAASRGLGRAAALALAAEGARVAICARGRDALDLAAAELRAQTGADVLAVVADVSRPADVTRLVRETVDRFGALDILVTNAGGPTPGRFDTLGDDAWQAAVDLTLLSVVRLCRAAVPIMRRRRWGRIVHVTSIAAKQPIDDLMLSNALRAAVVGFAKTLATELAAEGITVNCVAPGYTRTDRVLQLAGEAARRDGVEPETVIGRMVATIPAGRLGEPRELADLIAFLASDRGAYVTGTTIQVDGGFIRAIM